MIHSDGSRELILYEDKYSWQMKSELEDKDLDAISQRVFERIKPLMLGISKPPEKYLFDVKELAVYLGVPETWVYEHAKSGEIPCIKIGKYLRFKKYEIDKWLESNTIRPTFRKK